MSENGKATQKINLKLKYRDLIDRGTRIGETLENQNALESIQNILELLNTCENVAGDYARGAKIENTSDFILDAQIIKMSHDLLGSATEKMSTSAFNEDEYVAVLHDPLVPTNEGDKLLDIALECCRTSSIQLSLLGTFSFEQSSEPKEPKIKRERQARKPLGEKKAPQNITQIVKVDKGAEKINLLRNEIERICRERNKNYIPYYELIIDPDSFMTTIDNAFQLSFLIRDNIVGLKRINNEPHVCLKAECSVMTSNDPDEPSSITVQTVMSIDPPLWKMEIEKYNITQALLNIHLDENEDISDSD